MEEDSKADVTVVIRPKGWGARHTLALMAFLGFTCETMLRNFLTVTIVAMVNTGTHARTPKIFQAIHF